MELETFRDVQECRRKIAHYLEHDDERAEIAERGHRRALAEHTYRHRMERAVDALRRGPSPLVPRRRRHPSVADIADAAKTEPELFEVISRIPQDTRWGTAALSAAVAKGDGPLSRAEKLLLFMREYEKEIRDFQARKAAE